MLFGKKFRVFNSKSYNLDLVKENDEYEFLFNTLGSFHGTGVITNLCTLKTSNKANIHVETKDKTLIKWLIKFGFEEA